MFAPQHDCDTESQGEGFPPSLLAARQRRYQHINRALFAGACLYTLATVGWLATHRAVAPLEPASSVSLDVELMPNPPLQAPAPALVSPKRAYVPVTPVKPLPAIKPLPDPLPPPLQAIAPPTTAPPAQPSPQPASSAKPKAPSMSLMQSRQLEAQPIADYRLVGLLKLGDRSVALVSVDSVTQQIAVGEEIGTSGWTLTALTQRSAEIQRPNQKRQVYVGESF